MSETGFSPDHNITGSEEVIEARTVSLKKMLVLLLKRKE